MDSETAPEIPKAPQPQVLVMQDTAPWLNGHWAEFMRTASVVLLFIIACFLGGLLWIALEIRPAVLKTLEESSIMMRNARPAIELFGGIAEGVQYNMTDVIRDSLPESHEGMVDLTRGFITGGSSVMSILTIANEIGVVEALYPLLVAAGWAVADNRTSSGLAATGDLINWVAEKATNGDIDLAAGFAKNTTTTLLDYTMTTEAHESMRFGLEIANNSLPMLHSVGEIAARLADAMDHESVPVVGARVIKAIDFTTEGRGMYEWTRYVESLRDSSKTLLAQAVESELVGSISQFPSVMGNMTEVARSISQSEIRMSVGSFVGGSDPAPQPQARSARAVNHVGAA
jgi:hypothetical protein